jgi:mannose-6-phosphate isomerase-like protein (cupin superfamily)
LFVSLSTGRARIKSAAKEIALGLGQTIWTPIGQQERFENLGEAPLEFLRIDLKTAPVNPK